MPFIPAFRRAPALPLLPLTAPPASSESIEARCGPWSPRRATSPQPLAAPATTTTSRPRLVASPSPQLGAAAGVVLTHAGRWDRAARVVSDAMGTPYAFFAAATSVAVWLGLGHFMRWGAIWWLVMGTGASIVAYLMVFVVQTSQNRDTRDTRVESGRMFRMLDVIDARLDAQEALLQALVRATEEGRAASLPAAQEARVADVAHREHDQRRPEGRPQRPPGLEQHRQHAEEEERQGQHP
jgi:hypothetical protein